MHPRRTQRAPCCEELQGSGGLAQRHPAPPDADRHGKRGGPAPQRWGGPGLPFLSDPFPRACEAEGRLGRAALSRPNPPSLSPRTRGGGGQSERGREIRLRAEGEREGDPAPAPPGELGGGVLPAPRLPPQGAAELCRAHPRRQRRPRPRFRRARSSSGYLFRHGLNGFLAQRVPTLFLTSSFRTYLNCAVLKGMFPWSARHPLSYVPIKPVPTFEPRPCKSRP